MKKITKAAVFVTALMTTTVIQAADVKVIHAGELLAVPGEAPKGNQTIVVEDGRIKEVRDGFIAASEFLEQAEFVDLSTSFVMPGLMDMHVHLQR